MPIDPEAMHFAYTSSPAAPATDALERRAIGRIAAGVWAAIAFFGALATVQPLRFPELDVTATRTVVLSATAIAGVTLVVPWERAPKAFVNLLLVLMAGYIAALAHASGAVGGGATLLATFLIALAICFLPVRTSIAQVVMIALLLAGGLILLDKENAGVEALRTTLLLAVLLVLCALVLILRAVIAEREAVVGHPIFDTGVLDADGFESLLDRELSRASRHTRPLSVVLLEVSGAHGSSGRPDANDERVVSTVASVLLERVRVDDSAAHLGGLLFAIIAPETPAEGAASVAESASAVVRDGIESLGYSPASFEVTVGWAAFPHHAATRAELVAAAQHNLEAAAVRNELRPSPPPADASPSARPAAAGPDQH
jgi:diguanylate cyclase (GGDEF)-like protein